MEDDLLDESLLEPTPLPELKPASSAAPTIIRGQPAVPPLLTLPPEALSEVRSGDVPMPLPMDALSEVPAPALDVSALTELPAEAPPMLDGGLIELKEAQGDDGAFRYEICPQCGTPRDGASLCNNCGTRLVFKSRKKRAPSESDVRCKECGTKNKAGRRRCMNCGTRLPTPD